MLFIHGSFFVHFVSIAVARQLFIKADRAITNFYNFWEIWR